VIILIWIIVETALLGYISFLQPVIAIWGIAIIALTLLPKIRQFYAVKKVDRNYEQNNNTGAFMQRNSYSDYPQELSDPPKENSIYFM